MIIIQKPLEVYGSTTRTIQTIIQQTLNLESFKSKVKITGNTPSNGNTKDVEIIVPLKYLSNFWRTLEMPLINCEVNLILTWSKDCVITNSTAEGKFAITETKLYVPVVTLSTKVMKNCLNN